MITALAADAPIAAYTDALGWPRSKFFLGIDIEKLPEATDIPWIGVMPGGGGLGDGANTYEHSVRFAVVTRDDRVSRVGQVTKYVGFGSSEGLTDLVHRTISAYLESETRKTTALVFDEYRIEAAFPLYRATWTARIATEV
jgi:hypothetical protein